MKRGNVLAAIECDIRVSKIGGEGNNDIWLFLLCGLGSRTERREKRKIDSRDGTKTRRNGLHWLWVGWFDSGNHWALNLEDGIPITTLLI
jgi:hypothetical protein